MGSKLKPTWDLARILISVFGEVFCLYCWSFSVQSEQSQTTQNKLSSEKHFYSREINAAVNV